jgi:autotransporter translocation and assembly factor TamB
MDQQNGLPSEQKVKKRFLVFLIGTLLILLLLFFAGAPAISTALKNALISELQELSGEKISIHDLRLNLFPLSIEAKEIGVSDEGGKSVVTVERVKGYVGLSGLLNKTISIRRLVLKELKVMAERQKIEEIVKHIEDYLNKEQKDALKVKIKAVEIVSGGIQIGDDALKGIVEMKRLSGEMIIGKTQRIKADVKELIVQREGWPEIVCDVNTAVDLGSERIEIKRLQIGAFGSAFKGEGTYTQGKGTLKTGLSLLVNSVKRFFGLQEKGDGQITAKGEIRIEPHERSVPSLRTERISPSLQLQKAKAGFPGLKDVFVDLKLEGGFYVQTLMELLHVKERIEGLVDFDGEITGPLTDITGRAQARLQKGDLFAVDIDSLQCTVIYKNGVIEFRDGSGKLYNGTAQAEAVLHLPTAHGFTVNVKFQAIDSLGAFKLIQWDPGIPNGKVDGELLTSGSQFSPDGWFLYKNPGAGHRIRKSEMQAPRDDVLSRIGDIRGNYSLRGARLALTNLQINTSLSNVSANGTVDLEKKLLSLTCKLMTETVSDLTSPYYRGAEGRGHFSGEISGSFDDPRISGKISIANAMVEEYRTDSFIADFSYQKNMLDLRNAVFRDRGEEHRVSGRISFPQAKELFDLAIPVYDLSATLRDADFGKAVGVFSKDFAGTGALSADLKIVGKDEDIAINGKASVEHVSLYDVSFDAATAHINYAHGELSLKQARFVRGQSILTADGKVGPDGRFSYHASSDKLLLKDFGLGRMPDDAVVSMRSEGSGTFDNPSINLSAKVSGGTFKGRNMGSGTVNAVIQNRNITVQAALFNEKMRLAGRGYLDDHLPWNAELIIQPARYDFLISSLLKDVPEDLQLNLDGKVEMHGDRKNIEASAQVNHLALSLFEQSFSNDSDIQFSVMNKRISLRPFTIRSGETSFDIRGGLEIGEKYDLRIEGSYALSPLKGFSKNIGYLKGDADFVFMLGGEWNKPEIKGGMTISDASFGLRGYASYISSINGYISIDEDKIIVEKLSGKFGGGTLDLSGFAYLRGFLIKRFHLETRLDDITAKISQEFSVNLNGELLYSGTRDAMSVTGEVRINKARYRDQVEWRSWLLAAKGIEKPKSEMSVFERTELNIQVSGGENISVDNNIARAPIRIRGDMIVKGTASNPILFGRLETNEGYIYFRNNEFRIIHASADFSDPHRIKPILNLTAETSIQGYTIRLNLEGEMDRFNLSLSSAPPLEEVDILSLLTVGQLGKQTKGLEGGIGAGAATSFITGKQQDIIEERIRALTGIDRFQVEPYVSKSTGTVEPRVTVSERLISDKVFVTYTTSIGSTEEQILKVEYLLNRNISLIGTRDDIGSIGGDVKFRFEFK